MVFLLVMVLNLLASRLEKVYVILLVRYDFFSFLLTYCRQNKLHTEGFQFIILRKSDLIISFPGINLFILILFFFYFISLACNYTPALAWTSFFFPLSSKKKIIQLSCHLARVQRGGTVWKLMLVSTILSCMLSVLLFRWYTMFSLQSLSIFSNYC